MTVTEPGHDHPDDQHPDDHQTGVTPTRPLPIPAMPAAAPKATLIDQMGGPMGPVYSAIPVIVFVTANAFLSLPVTIGVSIAVGLLLTVVGMARGAGPIVSVITGPSPGTRPEHQDRLHRRSDSPSRGRRPQQAGR